MPFRTMIRDRAAENRVKTERPIRIGLLWHSANSGNLGVGALTVSNIALARGVAESLGLSPRFTIVSTRDGGRPYLTADEAEVFALDRRALLSPSGCWSVLRRQHCVLDIGAGDSFADIYGPKIFFFLWWSKVLALLGRVPLLLSPQTIGPFTRPPYTRLAAFALTRAFAVLARDSTSLEALRLLAPKARGVLSVDVAFGLPYRDQSALRGGDRIRVGINISGLLFNEARSGRNRFGMEADYAELTRRLLAELCARPEVEVHLITHVHGDIPVWDNDGPVTDEMADLFPAAVRAPDFADPSEAKSYISGLDFLVAGRMHACIAAYSSGTPVVPVAYSRKFSGLFGMLGYPWIVPVRGLDLEGSLSLIRDALARRGDLANDIGRGMNQVQALLEAYRAELRSFFSAAAAPA